MTRKSGKGVTIGAAMKQRMKSQEDAPGERALEQATQQPTSQQLTTQQVERVPPAPAEKPESFNTRLPAELHRRLKIHAATKQVKIQDVVAQALEEYLSKEEI